MERSELESGTNGGKHIKEMAAEKYDEVRELSSDVLARVETFVRERPGTAMLAALGAGFLIGRLIRRI
jgi:ElaB/YqjD/DUF883 family membrane-anchored ribosome-binding protein